MRSGSSIWWYCASVLINNLCLETGVTNTSLRFLLELQNWTTVLCTICTVQQPYNGAWSFQSRFAITVVINTWNHLLVGYRLKKYICICFDCSLLAMVDLQVWLRFLCDIDKWLSIGIEYCRHPLSTNISQLRQQAVVVKQMI